MVKALCQVPQPMVTHKASSSDDKARHHTVGNQKIEKSLEAQEKRNRFQKVNMMFRICS